MRGLGNLGKIHGPFGAAMLTVHIGRRRSDLSVKNLDLEEHKSQLIVVCKRVYVFEWCTYKVVPIF